MLIRFFKSSFLLQYFVLILIAAGLWIPGFLSASRPLTEPNIITPLYNLIYPVFSLHRLISPSLALAITFISSLTMNNILIYHDLAPKNNILPAFLLIIFLGSNPLTLQSYPLLLTLPLFTWYLHTIFRINDEPENFIVVLNASLLLSVISMIYTGALFLFGITWLFLLIFGTLNGRILVISLIGLLLPYLYLGIYYFWSDQLTEAFDGYRSYFAGLIDYEVRDDYFQLTISGFFLVLILAPSFYRIVSTLSKYGINFRKKMAAMAWLLVFSLPLLFLDGPIDYHTLLYLPASIMAAHYYNLHKKGTIHEIILAAYLILICVHYLIRS